MSQVLGALFAVLVGLLIFPTISRYQQTGNENTLALATAQQQKQLCDAALGYMQQNATAAAPPVVTVTVDNLKNLNFLPGGFSATNAYGQTWQVQVRKLANGNLQALVLSTGGIALPDLQANMIASLVGAAGGFIPLNDSTLYAANTAYGAYGSWTVATAGYNNIAGGHLAALVSYDAGQIGNGNLYRNAVPGQPQLNQMNTALNMGSSNINNAAKVGIGTASPQTELDVNGDVHIQNSAYAGYVNGVSSGLSLSRYTPPHDPSLSIIRGIDKSGDQYKYPAITLNPFGGKVGIGTSSPGYTLDAAGKVRLDSKSSYAFVMNTPSFDVCNQIKFQSDNSDVWIMGNNPATNKFNLWDARARREIFGVTPWSDLELMGTAGNVQVEHDLKVDNGAITSKTCQADNVVVNKTMSIPKITVDKFTTLWANFGKVEISGDGTDDYAFHSTDAEQNLKNSRVAGTAYLNDVFLRSVGIDGEYMSLFLGDIPGGLCGYGTGIDHYSTVWDSTRNRYTTTWWNSFERNLPNGNCDGHQPYTDCPDGYYRTIVFTFGTSTMWSCVKN
jgi:hypothetical protein